MIIKKLNLTSFGKFKDYSLELKEGVNLVYGENESGKSTLHSFIYGMFYGFLRPLSKKTLYLEDHENYKPLYLDGYRGSLEFELDNINYLIERDFKKSFEKTLVYEKTTGEDISHLVNDVSLGKVLQPGIYFFGISDIVFKNTVFISQKGIYTDNKIADELRDKLVNISSSKDEGISVKKALDLLDDEIKDIGTPRAYTSKYGLLISDLNEEITRLKEVEDKRSIYLSFLNQEMDINEKINLIKANLQKENKILDQINLKVKYNLYKDALAYKEDIERLEEKANEYIKYKDLDLDAYKKAEFLDYDIKKTLTEVEALKTQIKSLETEKDKIKTLSKSEKEDLDTIINDNKKLDYITERMKITVDKKIQKKKPNLVLILLLISLYLPLTLYSIVNQNYQLLIGIQPILGAILIMLFKERLKGEDKTIKNENKDLNGEILNLLSKHKTRSINDFLKKVEEASLNKEENYKKENEIFRLEDRISVCKSSLATLDENLKNYKINLEKILDDNKEVNIESFKSARDKKIEFDEITKEITYLKKTQGEILGDKKIEDLWVDEKNIDSNLLLQANNKEQVEKIKLLEKDLESLNLSHREVQVNINHLEETISKEASIKEGIFNLEEKIKRLDNRKESLSLAREKIKYLSTQIHRDYAPIINEKVGLMVNKITDGKYKFVKIDKNLNLNLISSQEGKMLSLNNLSGGSLDQIYFSLRMGLTSEVVDKNLPLVLDDCFIQYDDKRLLNILDFLIKKEEKRQIIIFTCQRREKSLLDKLGINYNYIKL